MDKDTAISYDRAYSDLVDKWTRDWVDTLTKSLNRQCSYKLSDIETLYVTWSSSAKGPPFRMYKDGEEIELYLLPETGDNLIKQEDNDRQ